MEKENEFSMKQVRWLKGRSLLPAIALLICLLAGGILSFGRLSAAYADTGGGCTASGGATCAEIFAVGRNTPINHVYPGPGTSFMDSTLRGYLYSNTSDHEKYMIFVVSVTLDPGADNLLTNYTTQGPDTSQNGSNSTMHVRLWGINDRSGCVGTPCTQMNYSDLEKPNYCQPNGGQSSWTLNESLTKDVGLGWTVTVPTYSWCTYVPSADIWSQYNNYTLQDKTQSQTRISQQFVFAQWEPDGCCGRQFKIGYSINTKLYETGPMTAIDGPTTGNSSATFAY